MVKGKDTQLNFVCGIFAAMKEEGKIWGKLEGNVCTTVFRAFFPRLFLFGTSSAGLFANAMALFVQSSQKVGLNCKKNLFLSIFVFKFFT